MATNSSIELQRLAAEFQLSLGLRVFRAILGNEDGRVDVPGQPGNVYIRYQTANGFSPAQIVPLRAPSLKKTPGAAVIIERDFDHVMCIKRIDFTGQVSAGTNPTINNIADDNNAYWISQQRIVTLASHPISSAADSMEVTVQPWSACQLSDNTFKIFYGEKVDLTSSIPAGAGEWCIACLFLKTDMTIEVVTSTVKTNPDTLGVDDIEECLAGRSTDALPIWAWRLYNGQTGITPGAPTVGGDDFWDLRLIVDSLGSGSGGMTDFTVAADSGTPATITDGDTVTFHGGTGITSSISGNTVTHDLDTPVSTTNGGTGQNFGASTGVIQVAAGTMSATNAPSFTDFTNAQHDHLDADDGGTLSAAAIASGQLALARGGTAADLSATGGANQFVKQSSAGAAFTVGTIADADVPDALTINGGTVDNTPIGATTASTAIVSALSLLIGGFKAIFTHANSADRTYTFPNATGTVVLKDTSDLLQNKSLEDSTTKIVDNGDNTKALQFEVSAISASTTRTATVANESFRLGSLVGDSGSGGSQGLAPAPGSGDAAAGKYLKADATWHTPMDYVLIRDEKTQNTNGGNFTSGSWQTRTLNTESSDAGGHASITSNQVTLDAGTWRIRASAPAFSCARHQARWQNTSDATTTVVGTSEDAVAATSQSRSFIEGRFTIATQKVFELQHQCQTTRNTDGFGVAANFTTEVYSVVELWFEN